MGQKMQQQAVIPTSIEVGVDWGNSGDYTVCVALDIATSPRYDDSMVEFARWIVSRDDAPPATGVRFRFKTYVAALVEAWSQNYGEYCFNPCFASDLNKQAVEAETILALHDPALIEAFCCSRFLSRAEARSLARSFGYSSYLGAWMQDYLMRAKVLILNIGPDGTPASTSPAPMMKAGGPPPKTRRCIVGEPGPEIYFTEPRFHPRAQINSLSFPRNPRQG